MTEKQRNYYIALMKLNSAKKEISARFKGIEDKSGIYAIWRFDPEQKKEIVYVGQAKYVLERLGQHKIKYDSHIDKSLKKYHLFDKENNPNGYHMEVLEYCPIEELDEAEQRHINYFKSDDFFILYNIESGGQGKGHTDIGERKPSKNIWMV